MVNTTVFARTSTLAISVLAQGRYLYRGTMKIEGSVHMVETWMHMGCMYYIYG